MAPEELSYGIDVTGLDPASFTDALRAVVADAMTDPMRMSTWMTGFALAEQNVGAQHVAPLERRVARRTPDSPGDKRFAEPEWSSNPAARGLRRGLPGPHAGRVALVDSARLPEATRRKARFAMQLMCDAFSPSNVPWLNPGVVKEATDTRRPEPRARHAKFPRRRHEQRRLSAPSRHVGLRAGREHRGDAGTRRDAQRADRADRVRAADAAGARDSAALQPAVDQQVLHHGSRAGAIVRRVGGASTAIRRS